MNPPSTNTPNQNPTNSGQFQDGTRPPMVRTVAPDPWDNPPPSNNKNLVIFGVAVGLGLVIFGVGLAFSGKSGASPTNAVVAAPAPTVFEEQRQMMREAMDMAKEAREAQREHMANMRQMMDAERGDGH